MRRILTGAKNLLSKAKKFGAKKNPYAKAGGPSGSASYFDRGKGAAKKAWGATKSGAKKAGAHVKKHKKNYMIGAGVGAVGAGGYAVTRKKKRNRRH